MCPMNRPDLIDELAAHFGKLAGVKRDESDGQEIRRQEVSKFGINKSRHKGDLVSAKASHLMP